MIFCRMQPITYVIVSAIVCAENHVRTWTITRFRGRISTQPGSSPIASFKILSLEGAHSLFYPVNSIGRLCTPSLLLHCPSVLSLYYQSMSLNLLIVSLLIFIVSPSFLHFSPLFFHFSSLFLHLFIVSPLSLHVSPLFLNLFIVSLLLHFILGPFGEGDDEQVFIQRVIPDTDTIFVRLSSTGDRLVS